MFGPRSQYMLVITVGVLTLFSLIPILAATTAEYTHTPLQALILTNAHVIPGQETKASYILESAWFAIRHAEYDALESLSYITYEQFHNRLISEANPLDLENIAETTQEWLHEYFWTPNAQLCIGTTDEESFEVMDGAWQQLPVTRNYNITYYYEQNGKLSDLMPIPTTNAYLDDDTSEFDYSYGTYNVPIEVETLNSYYRFAYPYLARNDHLVTVIEDIEKPGGIYETINEPYPLEYQHNYDPDFYGNEIPTKESIIEETAQYIVDAIGDEEYELHEGDPMFDEIAYQLLLVLRADEWDADYVVTVDECREYYPVDGEVQCETIVTPFGSYTYCWCEYDDTVGYRRFTAAEIRGTCDILLDELSTTSYEMNGETMCDNDNLEPVAIHEVTYDDDIELDEFEFTITYGETDSWVYMQWLNHTTASECHLEDVSALTCADIPYPYWFTNLTLNTADLAMDESIYTHAEYYNKW